MPRQSFIAKLLECEYAHAGDIVRYVNDFGQTLLVGILTEKGIIVPGHGDMPLNLARFEQISGMCYLTFMSGRRGNV
jgi:hypothetical protein